MNSLVRSFRKVRRPVLSEYFLEKYGITEVKFITRLPGHSSSDYVEEEDESKDVERIILGFVLVDGKSELVKFDEYNYSCDIHRINISIIYATVMNLLKLLRTNLIRSIATMLIM